MEVSFEPLQINNISTMNKSCVVEDNSIYEECSICCESFTNKSFINECLHPFCYQCILDWTKVKAVCPLCIGPITGILHNIRSQDDYDIEKVEPPRVDVLANIDNDLIFDIDDTDTESSYGGMESMDMESDYDNSIIYENDDFNDAHYDNETGNFFDYLSNNESSHDDDASVHSNEHEESEDEVEAGAEEDNSCNSSDQEDDEVQNEFFNVDSESDAEDEHADDEYDCDSNDGDNDADSDNDNDNNYFDNYEEDDDNDDDDEEPDHDDSDEDNDANDYEDTLDAETYDVSDDSSEGPDVEYNPSSTSEDEYYY